MTLEELKKKLKKAENIEITYQELNNNKFIATIKGIIKCMEKKLSKSDLILKELKEIKLDITQLKSDISDIKTRLTNIETDVSKLKIEAINHGWDLDHSK